MLDHRPSFHACSVKAMNNFNDIKDFDKIDRYLRNIFFTSFPFPN